MSVIPFDSMVAASLESAIEHAKTGKYSSVAWVLVGTEETITGFSTGSPRDHRVMTIGALRFLEHDLIEETGT